MKAREKPVHAGQPQPSSSGRGSRAIAGVAEVHLARRRERRARPRHARRQHAVEHVDAAGDHAEDALGVAEAHEVARLVGGQERRRPADRLEHLGPALAHREPAERVAVEAERDDLLDRAAPQLRVGAALRDPEPQLARARAARRSAARPRAACAAPPPRARRATRRPAGRCRGTSRCRSRAAAGSRRRSRA